MGSMTLALLSWNVNGLRTCYDRKYFLPVFLHNPGIVWYRKQKSRRKNSRKRSGTCVATIRISFCGSLPGSIAGVGLFSRQEPLSVKFGFGDPQFDSAGRVLIADYGTFLLLNIYFPLGIKPMETSTTSCGSTMHSFPTSGRCRQTCR